jgi:hypothetical protein
MGCANSSRRSTEVKQPGRHQEMEGETRAAEAVTPAGPPQKITSPLADAVRERAAATSAWHKGLAAGAMAVQAASGWA